MSSRLAAAFASIAGRTGPPVEAALILGSGLGRLAEAVESPVAIPYSEIAGFPISTAPGHAGRLVIGQLHGRQVRAVQRRGESHQLELPLHAVDHPAVVVSHGDDEDARYAVKDSVPVNIPIPDAFRLLYYQRIPHERFHLLEVEKDVLQIFSAKIHVHFTFSLPAAKSGISTGLPPFAADSWESGMSELQVNAS